tara:strand:+ start:2136 stop:2993 length:858 start_codon:yes stop_codon:yes gene_type:complete
MKKVILKSYAKLNLFLKVGKNIKRKSLHNIQSLIFLINLNDEIHIKSNKQIRDSVKFIGRFSKNVNNSNSVIKSIHLLRKKGFLNKKSGYEIVVKKNIPVFSGFGGGSSNAASLIKHFMKSKKISEKNVNYFSKYLGSDLRVFLKTKKIFQKNLLTIKKFNKNYKFYFVLVYPFLRSSTKNIYSRLNKFELIQNKNNYNVKSRLDLVRKLKLENNSLEQVVISKYSIVKKILKELELIKNCRLSRMTGSGSACFGLFLNKKEGTQALRQIKKRFPKFWCTLSKTI